MPAKVEDPMKLMNENDYITRATLAIVQQSATLFQGDKALAAFAGSAAPSGTAMEPAAVPAAAAPAPTQPPHEEPTPAAPAAEPVPEPTPAPAEP